MPRSSALLPILGAAYFLTACGGPQSALVPAGRDAERIAGLFTSMTAGAVLIWIAVVALAMYASRPRRTTFTSRQANALIIGGGVIFPVVVLTALLLYGLAPLPHVLAVAPDDGRVTIAVTGKQWWWRVRYMHADGRAFELANELRLPVGQRTTVYLESGDVIHSFWVPSLAGKMDMIPGRVNRIALEPTQTGVFRGACAEFCGASHAFMNLYVVVTEQGEFAEWAERQAQDASPPATAAAAQGQTSFLTNGCGACHTVRGTPATGRVGPDLTHVGSRLSIGAGLLPNTPGDLQRWIAVTDRVKPDVHMPAFNMLNAADLVPLAAYLSELR